MECYGGNENHLLMKVHCSRCQLRSTLSHEGFHPHFRQSPSVASMAQNESYCQSYLEIVSVDRFLTCIRILAHLQIMALILW
jgi:hypothetical protein